MYLSLNFSLTDGAVGGENSQTSEEQLEEPVTKRQKTEGYANIFYLTPRNVTYSLHYM